ncbi:MAG: AAA family ATPase [Acidobacteriota bacterium]|nr:AAA family ATPase [Acidobacteriota bacterium]
MVAASRDDTAAVLLHRLTLSNVLSFGPGETDVELGPLNVLIGPNGSGKSNLIAAIELLRAAPRDLVAPIRESGGIGEWLHKSTPLARKGSLEAAVGFPLPSGPLRYHLTFEEWLHRFHVRDEFIEDDVPETGQGRPYRYFGYLNGAAIVKRKAGADQRFARTDLDPGQTILSQRKDPHDFPEITYLGQQFDTIRIYREWSFGRQATARQPQSSDLPNDFLAEDTSNLALVLNRLRRAPAVKKRLLEMAGKLYEGLTDFDVIVQGGTVQVFLEERGITVPAARLSDGTLRYLCLLAILCDDEPPPLVCIEEPELGLHPDIMPTLAGLLREASTRCQLIVTTHSDVLVDALTEEPESVVVCEKHDGQTRLHRLSKEDLTQWLTRYSLGQLWMKGELGGSRW